MLQNLAPPLPVTLRALVIKGIIGTDIGSNEMVSGKIFAFVFKIGA